MKKFLAAIFALTLLITGCGGEKPSEPAQSKENTTIGVITHLNASEI